MSSTPPTDPWGEPGSGNQPPPPPGGYPPPPPSWEQPPPSGGYAQPGGAYPPPPPAWQQPQQPQGYYGGGPAPAPGGQLAGWWQRVGATLVDDILAAIVIGILTAGAKGAGFIIGVILWAVYVTMMLSRGGQTLGNKAVGTHVVDAQTGGPIGAGKALGRWAASELLGSFVPFFRLLDVLWPLWDRQNQTLHDKIAGTVVLRGQM